MNTYNNPLGVITHLDKNYFKSINEKVHGTVEK